MSKTVAFVLVAGLAAASPAAATDIVVYSGLELEYLADPAGAGTGDTTTLSSYFEAELGSIYAGIATERAELAANNELSAYLGYRGSNDAGLSYDIAYTHYSYPALTGADYGELTLSLGTSIGDTASVTGYVYFYPDTGLASTYVEGTLTLGERLEGSVNFGVYEVAGASNESEWDVGATFAVTDEIGIDARYYDGTEYVDSYFGLSVSVDTTLFGG